MGSWGAKGAIGARYYLKPCRRGFAFGLGLTRNTGVSNFKYDFKETNGATTSYNLNLLPIVLLSVNSYKYWSMGKNGNRFYLQLGLSQQLGHGTRYTVLNGKYSTEAFQQLIRLLQPGLIVTGLGFSFGIK